METESTYGYSLTKPPFDPIMITMSHNGYYDVRRAGRNSDNLCWGEMIEQVICLTFPRGRTGYTMETPEMREARENYSKAKYALEALVEKEKSDCSICSIP